MNLSSYDYLVLPDLGPNLGEAYGRGKYAGGSTRKLLGVWECYWLRADPPGG